MTVHHHTAGGCVWAHLGDCKETRCYARQYAYPAAVKVPRPGRRCGYETLLVMARQAAFANVIAQPLYITAEVEKATAKVVQHLIDAGHLAVPDLTERGTHARN